MRKEKSPSSQSARALFYSNTGRQASDRVEDMLGSRSQQLLGGSLAETEGEVLEEAFDLEDADERTLEIPVASHRGIRYRFVQDTPDGRDQVVDLQTFSGNWDNLHLTIASNGPGYLYVLSEVGKGKWQLVRPQSLKMSRSAVGAIEVSHYQPVAFALNQVTNSLGKPIVLSLTVLLSSAPIPDLGTWLGVEQSQNSEGRLFEQGDQDTFVIDLHPSPDSPFRVNIPLPQ